MLDQPQRQGLTLAWKAGDDMRASNGSGEPNDKARRFRDAALPHLDDVYTLARYLLRDGTDAEDAVQECYLRALRHFDTYRGPAMKPWLFAILRNVCRTEFLRRSGVALTMDGETEEDEDAIPDLAGGAGLARSGNAAPVGCQNDPPSRRGASRPIP